MLTVESPGDAAILSTSSRGAKYIYRVRRMPMTMISARLEDWSASKGKFHYLYVIMMQMCWCSYQPKHAFARMGIRTGKSISAALLGHDAINQWHGKPGPFNEKWQTFTGQLVKIIEITQVSREAQKILNEKSLCAPDNKTFGCCSEKSQ